MSRAGSYTFEWNGEQVSKDVTAAAQHGITRAGIQLQRQMVTNLSHKGPSTPGAMPGQGMTGNLGQSITVQSTLAGRGNSIIVGTPLEYGRHLEYGFTSTPKKVKRIPVPVNREAKLMLKSLASPTGRLSLKTKNLKMVFRGKGKDPLLVEKIPTRGKYKGQLRGAIFVLKKSVTIAPRPWVNRSAAMAGAKMREAFYGESSKMLARSASARMKGAA